MGADPIFFLFSGNAISETPSNRDAETMNHTVQGRLGSA